MVGFIVRAFILALWAFVIFLAPHGYAGGAGALRAVLSNGLRVVIVKNNLAPVVTTQVNYLVGSNEAPPGFPGMAHAQEHMMFRGSPGLSAEQLAAITAAMGGRCNADTQQTVTQYFLTVPAEDLEVALRIEAIRMRDVLDSDTLWEEERGAIEQEVVQDLSSPMYVFYTRLLARMFAGTPYAHDALGTRSSFERTTGAMLKKFYDTWYAPNNAVLVIAGDVEPKDTLLLVKRLFEGIPSHSLPDRPKVKFKPVKPSTIHLETDLPYGMAVVSYRLPGYFSPDYAGMVILADVLDSRRGDLYGLAARGKALFAGFGTNFFPEAGMGFATVGFPRGKNGRALIDSVQRVISGYLKKGVPSDLVNASKKREIAAAQFRRNSIEGLASEWSRALAIEGRNSPDDDIEAIKDVTISDVNRIARKYLRNDTSIVGLLIPHESAKPVSLKNFRGRESFAPKETRPVSLPAWAKKVGVLPSLPSYKTKPEVSMLGNGLRVIVLPETISHTVSVYGRIRNSPALEEPKGKEGVSDVVDDLFSYGTTSLDRLSLQKELDRIAGDMEVGAHFSLQVLSQYFDRGVRLLADNLLHPGMPEAAFRIIQRETIGRLRGELRSPSYVSRRALLKRLYPKGDPKLREATPESVAAIKLDDVVAYYEKAFRPDLTSIVVIGDIDPEKARETIDKYFKDWKGVGPKPKTTLPSVPPNKPAAAIVPDKSRVQDKVTLAETLGITRTHPDYYPLQLGLHVLSGGFYATRLYRDLREKSGLVYSVEAFLEAGKTRSVFGVVYGCDPENVSKARDLIVKDLEKMQKAPVTETELKRAKLLLIREIPLSSSSVQSIAESMLSLTTNDLPLDEPLRAAKQYSEIGAEQVRSAFKKWIRPQDFVQITLGPRPQ